MPKKFHTNDLTQAFGHGTSCVTNDSLANKGTGFTTDERRELAVGACIGGSLCLFVCLFFLFFSLFSFNESAKKKKGKKKKEKNVFALEK
jgi:hypothetical protein